MLEECLGLSVRGVGSVKVFVLGGNLNLKLSGMSSLEVYMLVLLCVLELEDVAEVSLFLM